MRRFEFADEKSNKFWEIGLSGNLVTVTFGRAGTPGQTQTKSFASDAEAKVHHDRLVAEKTRKGYVEVASTAANLSAAELDDAWFWKVISDSKRGTDGDVEEQTERLEEMLSKFSDEELVKFNDLTSAKIADSYKWEIWAAAFYDNDGCSDDSFMDWRAGLVLAGKRAYESIMADADNLAQFDVQFAESFSYLPTQIWEERHGSQEMPTTFNIDDHPDLEDDEPFPEDDEEWFAKTLPRLRKKKRGDAPIAVQANPAEIHPPSKKGTPTTITIKFVRPTQIPDYAAYNMILALQEALKKCFGNCGLEGNSSDRVTLKINANDQLWATQMLPEVLGSVDVDHTTLDITFSETN